MGSARNHMSDDDLRKDAAYWRGRETYTRQAARMAAGWNKELCLRAANIYAMRAQASENVLYKRSKPRDEESQD